MKRKMMAATRSGAATRWIFTAATLFCVAAPSPAFAQSAQVSAPFCLPASADLSKIQKRFDSGGPARIIGPGGTQIVDSPRITAEGVAWHESPAAGPDTPPSPVMLQWSEIERLQARGNGAGTGALVGAIVVGGLSLAAGMAVQSDQFVGGNGAAVLAATAGGALLGAGLGALIGLATPKWVDVHVGRTAK